MTFEIKYASANVPPGDGSFRLGWFSLYIDADTALSDAEGEVLSEELSGEVEQGLSAIAERLREKFAERGITRITVTT